MTIRFDWKFWVALLATLAGVLVPVWLWRADLSSRSLHFRQLSQTSLHPPESDKVPDLTISVGGVELAKPYLTVLELVNDGVKPVPTADFESSLELVVQEGTSIARARVTETKPTDLAASVEWQNQSVKIKPLLINPGDSLTLAVITGGEAPNFRTRARIAGIQSVPILDMRKPATQITRGVSLLAAAFLFLIAATSVVDALPSKTLRLRPRASFLIFIVTLGGGSMLASLAMDFLGVPGFWPLVGVFGVLAAAAAFASAWLNKKIVKASPRAGDAA